MPATINEHTQYLDGAGLPLVTGKLYIGTQNADPVANVITIFSDRALTVAISNPQILDANGRTTNKIWVPGRYSIRIDDVNDVQKYQELDNGEESATGITSLTNVSGTATITATATTTIVEYTDRELYTFRAAGLSAGAVTLNIDGIGAKSILKNHDKALDPGNLELDQNVIVSYNASDDVFELVNQNLTVANFYKGVDIASAATLTLGTGGNYFDVTGTTTITSIVGVAETKFILQFDSALNLTDSANFDLGGVGIAVQSGDRLSFIMLTNSLAQLLGGIFENGGLTRFATQAEMEGAAQSRAMVSPGNQKFYPGVIKASGRADYSSGVPTLDESASHNMTGITDTATGRLTVTFDQDFSGADEYVIIPGAEHTRPGNLGLTASIAPGSRAAGSTIIELIATNDAFTDPPGDGSLFWQATGDH